MARVTRLGVDQSADAAHVVFNEDSEEDHVIVQTLCGDMERSGIPTTYYQRDGRDGGLEMRDRGSMMEKAVWLIIIYLQTPVEDHDAMFAFEENMALFLAITHDVQNVIFLLGGDVEPVVSKGFPYLRMKKDKSWLGRLTGSVKTTPSKITCNLLYRYCYQLVQPHESVFMVTRESLSLWASLFSPTNLSLAWTLQCSSGSQAYVVTFQNGSLVIKRSEIEDNGESTGLVTNTSLSENAMNLICDVADADSGDNGPAVSHPQGTLIHNINWTDVSTIKPSLKQNESYCTTVVIRIMQIMQFIFLLGIAVMLTQSISPVIVGVDKSTFLPYTAEVQMALVIISFLLSAVNVFRSIIFVSTELPWMTGYQLLVTLVSVIMQGLFTADLLPFPVDMTPRIGGIAAFGIFNMAFVSDFLASNRLKNKCKLIARVLTLGCMILLLVVYCTMCQLRYQEQGVTHKATSLITAIHFVSQCGLFKCIMKYLRYIIRLFYQRKIGKYVELLFFVIYALIWFIPILYFY
ncbi:uncharacterized protein LOC124290924 [Haliotis rubra]|uniref:uncharacterized protein LOC124290924 n=1 Tax=Haliotis rubra TaxID=36100 RepID=UPI001EE57A19|nr:uncharacterized protein LOC124290924 [Haliotis rubra]